MRDQIESVLRQTPQLKGSEIAKKIGVKKKKVNSFLYVNQDIFVQNSDFRWSIINPNELTIAMNTILNDKGLMMKMSKDSLEFAREHSDWDGNVRLFEEYVVKK